MHDSNGISPSQAELKYALEYARTIYEKVQLMSNASNMVREDLVTKDNAQKIIDYQKKMLVRELKHLQIYLGLDEA